MTVHPEDRLALRRYLLGERADEEAARRLDARLLADDLFFEQLEAAEDELIEDYLADSLSPAERARFESHFLTTKERKKKLASARALRRYVAAHPQVPSLFVRLTPYWKGAAAALLVLGLGLLIWRLFIHESELDRGLRLLAEAHRDRRFVEARVSGLAHAPLITLRGDEAERDTSVIARAKLLEAVRDAPGPAAHHALGRFYLAGRRFDEAIRELETALADAPDDKLLRSDLGAAYLERGRAPHGRGENGVEDLGKALDHLNRALAPDDALPEALFNRAITYEEMKLLPRAEADWRKYLALDPDSPWATEAQARLRRLEEQRGRTSLTREQLFESFLAARRAGRRQEMWDSLARASSRTGNHICEKLLDDYLAAEAAGRRAEADELLGALVTAGELKASLAADSYVAAVGRAYESATAAALDTLRRARALAREGQQQIIDNDFRAGAASYAEAQRLFAAAGDAAEARQAEFWLAICAQQSEETEPATFERLARVCEREGYKWLAARALRGLATEHFNRAERSEIIRTASAGLALAEEARDAYGMQSLLVVLIQSYQHLGNRAPMLDYARRALDAAADGQPDPKQVWLTYTAIASALDTVGLHAAAAACQEAVVPLAVESGDAQIVDVTFANLGAFYGRARDFDEGFRNARRAFAFAEQRRAEPTGQRVLAYAALQLGNLYRQAGDHARALEHFDLSIALYSEANLPVYLYYARKGKLLTLLASGDFPAAKEELAAALLLFDGFRSKILEAADRDSFYDAEHGIYDLASDFEYTVAGDAERAFECSEEGRARSLLTMRRPEEQAAAESQPGERPLRLAEIRARIPERAQLLQYAALEDKLLIWLVSKDEFRAVATDVPLRRLEEKVARYLRAAQEPNASDGQLARLAGELYDLTIRPVEGLLDKGRRLYVAPDKILHRVPFPALVNPSTGRHLLQDYPVVYTPSATLLVVGAEAARARTAGGAERLLSVGDPAFDRATFAGLPELPGAAREAREVAALYGASALTGPDATESEVARLLPAADVIHFASHSLLDESRPLRSKLLLTPEPGGRAHAGPEATATTAAADGSLTAEELYGMRLPHACLVVLSACSTADGRVLRGEGALSMARPFLAAGAQAVVASLWPVDSDATAGLMISFHRYRRLDRLPAADALRRAQLDLLRGPQHTRHPFYWASFNLIGADADF